MAADINASRITAAAIVTAPTVNNSLTPSGQDLFGRAATALAGPFSADVRIVDLDPAAQLAA
ncbi:hypothetical protein SALB1_3709 [Salinisphaera sp. LB1]|nr:hypothetical protein SALB1_3709 [Salinisphaera sp. LB1]